jgi:trk system potassium uptake protein TrkH
MTPAQALAVSFVGLIAAGTVLLGSPISWAPGFRVVPLDAFFTATSAVCVTGLIVVDTSHALSTVGQLVVLALIQAGGLGYMVITTLVAAALGKRLTLQEQLTLQEALNVESREGLVRFTLVVFKMTLGFELLGAFLLALRWWPDMGLGRAAYFGVYHAVSAFNNAGFALFPDNLIRYSGDLVVNVVISGLIICGGLGFVVIREVINLRAWPRLSLHTRFALSITVALIVLGTIALYLLEYRNPETLRGMSPGRALLAAYFQSVSARTAGFNTINLGAAYQPTLFLLMALMFIGASPGGTGGGVKTTTFGITVLALWATVRGGREPTVFKRRLAAALVPRAFFISLIAFLALNVVAGLVLIFESHGLLAVLFETTSAFGTVGLSTGLPGSALSLSGHFSDVGKLLMIVMMFMGRVGPLTLAVALARGRPRPRLRYPEGRVLIG